MMDHAKNASIFNRDQDHVTWHNEALWHVRKKRDQAGNSTPDWEWLRTLASEIKEHTLNHLRHYLEEFEKNLIKNGWTVHWAADASAHNQIIHDLLTERDITVAVKSKSMLTEECRLNEFLKLKGIEVIDTDLGERIVQLAGKPPSHIVLPAIHLKKREISEIFHDQLNSDPSRESAEYLTRVARVNLRNYLIHAKAAISGVNFGLAHSGTVVVCTNEGNADMGIHHAKLYIAAMGIEKLIPGKEHLPVFLKLLARSATGQAITAYTSHLVKPPPGKEFHIILVDNGRSDILKKEDYHEVLKCIRCGACMNTCPVYRRSGGYSYEYTIPGPIGSVLAPLNNLHKYASLPFASSLCGSCTDVCPVKINLHELLYRLRSDAIRVPAFSRFKKIILGIFDRVLYHNSLYLIMSHLFRIFMKFMPRGIIYNRFNIWGKAREFPDAPAMTFREWYKKQQMDG